MSTLAAVGVGIREARRVKRESRERAASHRAGIPRFRYLRERIAPASMSILGLGLFSAAAFTVALPLGLAVAGAACLVLEWRISE